MASQEEGVAAHQATSGEPPLMRCSHRAQATMAREDGTRVPVCAICFGIRPGADQIEDAPPPEPKGYKCPHCGKISERPVAFSSPVADKDGYGSHYDGCRGWD